MLGASQETSINERHPPNPTLERGADELQ
jgi:hypothetical protein